MIYFAYGSNLDFVQMRSRCPSAQFVAVAKLPDHQLAFTRRVGITPGFMSTEYGRLLAKSNVRS